jgi:hypothetical protein
MAYALGVKGPGGEYREVEGGGYAPSEDGRFGPATGNWGIVRAYREDSGEWVPLNLAALVRAGDRVALDARAGVLGEAGAREAGATRVALTARRSPTLRG